MLAIIPSFVVFLFASAVTYALSRHLTPKQRPQQQPFPELFQGSEGRPRNYVLGAQTRVRGTVVWAGPAYADGGGSFVQDLAVEFAYRLPHSANLSIRQIKVNGEIVWWNGGLISNTGTFSMYVNAVTRPRRAGRIESAPGGYDLTNFKVHEKAIPLQMSGWGSNPNSSVQITGTRRYPDGTTRLDFITFPDGQPAFPYVEELNASNVTLAQSFVGYQSAKLSGLRLYEGGTNYGAQPRSLSNPSGTEPDDIMAAEEEGDHGTPSFRFRCAARIDRLELVHFGGQLPLDWEAEIWSDDHTLEGAISDALQVFGLDPSEIDNTAILGKFTLRGLHVDGIKDGAEWLDQMLGAFDLDFQEKEGKLHTYERGAGLEEFTIPRDDCAVHVLDTKAPPAADVQFGSRDLAELPNTASVRFVNAEDDQQPGTVVAPLLDEHPTNVLEIDLSRVVMTKLEGQNIGRRELRNLRRRRRLVKVEVGFNWEHVLPGDVMNVTDRHDIQYRVLVETKERGANGVTVLSGRNLDPSSAPAEATLPENNFAGGGLMPTPAGSGEVSLP